MHDAPQLKPATELAQSPRRFPGESAQYRQARNALLAEEIELRRHIERVAAQRRALPPGGELPQDYLFEGEHGPIRMSHCSATTTPWSPTTGCTAPTARGHARCAPACWAPSMARCPTSCSAWPSR